MKMKLTPLAIICSALLVGACSWDGGNDPAPEAPVVPQPNQAPTANNGSFVVAVNGTTSIDISRFGTDRELDELTFSITVEPQNGTLTPEGGNTYLYTPTTDFAGEDSFSYEVSDGEYSDSGTITITVSNDAEEQIDSVVKLNAAIAAATAGDTIELAANGVFSNGVIELNKAVVIDGNNQAKITGSACFKVAAAGATIQNLTFENDFIGLTVEQDNAEEAEQEGALDGTCAISNSDGQTGAISIIPTLDDGSATYDADLLALEPVLLKNLTFDASANTEQSNYGNTKASWITSFTLFELHDSQFIGLSSDVQNNGVYVNCSRSKEAVQGSMIHGTEFTITGTGTKETSAIKMGDSSSKMIKVSEGNQNCNVTITGNTFSNYVASQAQDTNGITPTAIFAWDTAIKNDATLDTDNTFTNR